MMIEDLKSGVSKKSIVAMILFGAIIIVFVFFGYQGKGNRGSALGYAARVNEHVITIADFQATYDQMTKQYAPYFGDQINKNPRIQSTLRNSALDQLIQREIVAQGALKEGFLVTNSEIRDYIMKAPAFQKDGVFQRSYYDGYIQNVAHTSASRFEDQLKRDLAISRMRHSFAESFSPFDAEVSKIQKLKSKQYTVDYVKFDSEDFKKKAQVSDAEAAEFLKSKDNELQVQLEFDKLKKSVPAMKDKKLEDVQKDIAKRILAEDKTEKMSEELGLKIKKEGEFEAELGKMGLKWQTSKPFAMDQTSIPEIGVSDKLMNEVFKLTKKGEMIPEVFTTNRGTFAVRLNKIEDKPSKDSLDTVKSQMGEQRANEAFSKWASALAKGYSIEKNMALIDVSGGGSSPMPMDQ
jgi:peptidyl-prolyl cis-trans isomerase D